MIENGEGLIIAEDLSVGDADGEKGIEKKVENTELLHTKTGERVRETEEWSVKNQKKK